MSWSKKRKSRNEERLRPFTDYNNAGSKRHSYRKSLSWETPEPLQKELENIIYNSYISGQYTSPKSTKESKSKFRPKSTADMTTKQSDDEMMNSDKMKGAMDGLWNRRVGKRLKHSDMFRRSVSENYSPVDETPENLHFFSSNKGGREKKNMNLQGDDVDMIASTRSTTKLLNDIDEDHPMLNLPDREYQDEMIPKVVAPKANKTRHVFNGDDGSRPQFTLSGHDTDSDTGSSIHPEPLSTLLFDDMDVHSHVPKTDSSLNHAVNSTPSLTHDDLPKGLLINSSSIITPVRSEYTSITDDIDTSCVNHISPHGSPVTPHNSRFFDYNLSGDKSNKTHHPYGSPRKDIIRNEAEQLKNAEDSEHAQMEVMIMKRMRQISLTETDSLGDIAKHVMNEMEMSSDSSSSEQSVYSDNAATFLEEGQYNLKLVTEHSYLCL